LIDLFGLRDRTEQETRAILRKLRSDQNAPLLRRTYNAFRNHFNNGDYDFITKQKYRNDTFSICGAKYNASEFGNFVAGYTGVYHSNVMGLFGVLVMGVILDLQEEKSNTDFDEKSRPYIFDGADFAWQELEDMNNNTQTSNCGCKN